MRNKNRTKFFFLEYTHTGHRERVESRKHPQVDSMWVAANGRNTFCGMIHRTVCVCAFFYSLNNRSETDDRMSENQNVHSRTFISCAAIEVFRGCSCFAFAFHLSSICVSPSSFLCRNPCPFGLYYECALFSFCSLSFVLSVYLLFFFCFAFFITVIDLFVFLF